MGLDVYVHKLHGDAAAIKAVEQEYEERAEALWGPEDKKSEEFTEEEKGEIRVKTEALQQELGLEKDGQSPAREEISEDSALHPDHLFKVGYFRSSYNDGGINHVLETYGIPDLYAIFEPGEGYEFLPNWEACRARAKRSLAILQQAHETIGQYSVEAVRNYGGEGGVESEAEALQLFLKHEREGKEGKHFSSYSNKEGRFSLDEPMKVQAVIYGSSTTFGFSVYLIKENEEGLTWYIQALEIVIETIEHILGQPDSDSYFLHWSA